MAKVVLITGAARRIGARTAEHFHEHGYSVLIHYRNSREDADALAAKLNAARPDSARLLQADLEQPDQVRRLASDALAAWQQLDALVNNASSFYPTPLGEATDADWDTLLGSNLRAPFILTQALAPALAEQSGSVVNIIDIYADKPLWQHSLYCMAKAGLASLTKSSARELGPQVRVNGVAPGPILWPEQGQDNQDEVLASTALKRSGDPDDIAATVLWLVDNADYISGQILAVDGGRSLSYSGS
jgi:pteridine reductase